MAIKKIDAEGITIDFTFGGRFKGIGRAKGLDGMLTLSGTSMQMPSGVGSMMG